MIAFAIPTQPLPKERPRFSGKHAYTSKKTSDYEALVADYAALAVRESGGFFAGEHLSVALCFYRKGQVKADMDNLCKAVLDAANKILWGDDKQIRQLSARVIYGADEPSVMIEISVIE